MKYEYEELKSLPVFSGVETKKDLDWFLKCADGKLERYEDGAVIAEKGEDLYFAGVVVTGQAALADGEKRQAGDFLFLNYEAGKSAPALETVRAEANCTVLWLRWMRTVKLCNFDCSFHKSIIACIHLLQAETTG